MAFEDEFTFDFLEWFVSLTNLEVVRVRSALAGIQADGLLLSGCSDLGSGLWLMTDKLQHRYLRLYLSERPDSSVDALYGSISAAQQADPAEIRMARLLRD